MNYTKAIVKRTLIVPATSSNTTSTLGAAETRKLDVALMQVGFKLSQELASHLSTLYPVQVKESGLQIIEAVKELVGADAEHNPYFASFPEDIPDTEEFWMQCIIDALFTPESAANVAIQLATGCINLLDLPKYGRLQHTYEEMLALHEQFIPSVNDRVTILHLGESLAQETEKLYISLAESNVPLNDTDKTLLKELAKVCIMSSNQPSRIPVRDHRSVINQVRLEEGMELLIDTPTDILRLIYEMSGVEMTKKAKIRTIPRKTRRVILHTLNTLIQENPAKLADVMSHRSIWKQLARTLRPHEHKELTHAHEIWAVANGVKKVQTFNAKKEQAFSEGNLRGVIGILQNAPGMLYREMDRILRSIDQTDLEAFMETVQRVSPDVSSRVIIALREHLHNRVENLAKSRVFANHKGTVKVIEETRQPLTPITAGRLMQLLDTELFSRLPELGHLVVHPEVLNVALPQSLRHVEDGFMVYPRGTIMPVSDGILRFFIHWLESGNGKDEYGYHRGTDYDLGALYGKELSNLNHVSWTCYKEERGHAYYSGDLTCAPGPEGATEFIDIRLGKIDANYIVPVVNYYGGEKFTETDESYFGFMHRRKSQYGAPFEPRTVRSKSDVRGKGNVAYPIVFFKNEKGHWQAKWLHMYIKGQASCNATHNLSETTYSLIGAALEHEYLQMKYLVTLLRRKAQSYHLYSDTLELDPETPVTYIGVERPEGLPKDSKIYTLQNLYELIPA